MFRGHDFPHRELPKISENTTPRFIKNTANTRYTDAICGSGARIVIMKHTEAIVSLHVSLRCQRVVSLDSSGLIIVTAIRSQYDLYFFIDIFYLKTSKKS